MNIELTTNPTAEDAKTISEGLINFNREAIGDEASPDAAIEFSVFSRDDNGNITGGIRATCCWNTLNIECIWVSEDARGKGVGAVLVEKAEQFAIKNGFEQVLLETTSWQAKPFYEKLGYEVMATLPQYPKGHAMHFMTKKLVGK